MEVEYLGHIVGSDGVRVDPKKIQAMKDWPHPKTLKSLQGFLGLTRYYWKSVCNYGKIYEPLTHLLKTIPFVGMTCGTSPHFFEELHVFNSDPCSS